MANRIYCVFGYECNNNCLICAVDAEARRKLSLSSKDIFKVLEKIYWAKSQEIEISGGEPTCRPELFPFLERLCNEYPYMRYILLTNGRKFSNASMAARLADLNPSSILIPIHADTPQVHDRITQASGSFNETMQGIQNLYEYGQRVVLKNVVNGISYRRLPQFVEMIAQSFPDCQTVTLNGLDVQGKALINKDTVGVKLTDAAPYVRKAIDAAKNYGLTIRTYSMPPCILGENYASFVGEKAVKNVIAKTPKMDMISIGTTYGTADKCRNCRYFSECTGTWHTYLNEYGTDELKPIE